MHGGHEHFSVVPGGSGQREAALCGAALQDGGKPVREVSKMRAHFKSDRVGKNLNLGGEQGPDAKRVRRISDTRLPIADISEQLRSEEHTSELQSLMRISYDVLC